MTTIPQMLCCAIPPHMLKEIAAHGADPGTAARATIAHMREIARERTRPLIDTPRTAVRNTPPPRKSRHVYDAQQKLRLPGKLVKSEHKAGPDDLVVNEAYAGSGGTHDFFLRVLGRNSIDGRGMRLDSTVHYGKGFSNAMWNGRQMIYGDGDGVIFNRFTGSIDVIGHELTHGVTQSIARLIYQGQTGALNEHLSDVMGTLVKQWLLGLSADRSDWLIGKELFTANVNARGVRSMSHPGTAYDDPILGRDPQPSHMSGYVETDEDNGGVHINSGILNRAFYETAIAVGGYAWDPAGKVWFRTLEERLRPNADFHDFASATTEVARDLYGRDLQLIVENAWRKVGLDPSLTRSGASRRSRRRSSIRTNERRTIP